MGFDTGMALSQSHEWTMAEDEDDYSIWWLLADEHAFTTKLTANSKKLADELVRSFLEEGEIDRDGLVRYRIWQIRALPGGAPSPYDGAFWQSDPERGVRCEIDHPNSSAYWTGPASAEWKAFGRETAEYQVVMIRLNHPIFLEFLLGVGLPAEQPASEPAMEPAPTSATEPIAGKQPQIVGSLVAAESADAAAINGAVTGVAGTLAAPEISDIAAVAGTVRWPSAEPIPLKKWFRAAKREHPQLSDETIVDWAKRLIEKMKAAKDAGRVDRVWPQATMERRLRDRDEDDNGEYQLGN